MPAAMRSLAERREGTEVLRLGMDRYAEQEGGQALEPTTGRRVSAKRRAKAEGGEERRTCQGGPCWPG